MNITWDPIKAEINLKKHGVSFEEAETVLLSDVQLTLDDDHHDDIHKVVVGFSSKPRLLTVVTCIRDDIEIRIISARKATKKEMREYEKRIRSL